MPRMIPGFGNVTAFFARNPRSLLSAGMSLLLHVSLLLAFVLIAMPTPRGGDFPPPPIAVTLVTVAAMPTAVPRASALASLAPSAAQPELLQPQLRQSQTQLFPAIPNLVQTIAPAPAPPSIDPARSTIQATWLSPPKPTPPTPTQTAQATPSPPTPRPVRQPVPEAPVQVAMNANAPANAPAQHGIGDRGRVEKGSTATVSNGSMESPGDAYFEEVRRWIEQFKKYPNEAFKQNQEGTVSVRFKFGRDGTILGVWIDKSSGHPLLDQAALDMIRAASPISKIPDHYPGETLTLVMAETFEMDLLQRLFH